ncbi:MAG: hypothetical protein U0X20_21970 [Caldilineaceae bacterium]
MTPGAIFVSGCTLAVLAVGVWVVRPGGPDPHDPRQAAAARQEHMLALAGVILLAVLATAAAAQEMAR